MSGAWAPGGSVVTDPFDADRLMERLAAGDRDALRDLYEATAPRMYGIALRILRDGALAGAATRALYLDLWTGAGAFAAPDGLVDAMAARVRALALDAARERAESGTSFEPFEVDDAAEDPLATSERSPALLKLLTCLGQLPEDRRRMLLLAYYDGWSRDALSIYLDAPPHAVNTWIWRSVAELDACLHS